MTEPLRPARGGFLRPFGCGWFIREFLSGNSPNGSPTIDPSIGAPQADTFYYYKTALREATALDRATRMEEKRARREKRRIDPDSIDKLTRLYLRRMPYKARGCRYHSFVVYFSTLQRLGWVEPASAAGVAARSGVGSGEGGAALVERGDGAGDVAVLDKGDAIIH